MKPGPGMALAACAFWGAPAAGAAPEILAQVTAVAQTVLSASLDGQLSEFPVEPGDAIADGALLARVDCDQHEARLTAARAAQSAAKTRASTAKRLRDLRSVTDSEVQMAQAELARAEAEGAVLDAIVKDCDIRAPWAGIVAERYVEPFQFVRTGQEVLSFFDPSAMRIEFLAPSDWLVRKSVGARLRVTVLETGQDFMATILRFGGVVDPISRTIEVVATLDGDIAGLKPGMSAAVTDQ